MVSMFIITSCGKVPIKMQKSSMSIQAWTYPDKNYDASPEIADGRRIDVLKPQYYTLGDNGMLQLMTSGYNAYNATNVALVKQHSSQQFVMISGNTTGISTLTASQQLTTAFINTITSFLFTNNFTGAELDFEGFADWTPTQYNNYKAFVKSLGSALHTKGYKLMIDGPAISDKEYQGYYPQWNYSDFDNIPQVDYIVAMAYDYDFDQGAGSAIAPLSWLGDICQWMLSNISDHSRIVVAINSYGYHEKLGIYNNVVEDTYQQSMQFQGFNTATRDASSGEMTWTNAGIFYNYSDQTTIQGKVNVVLNAGLNAVSIWHLGGGNPFPAQLPQPTPVPTPTPSPVPTPQPTSLTLSQDQIKAIAGVLSLDQITALKNIVG